MTVPIYDVDFLPDGTAEGWWTQTTDKASITISPGRAVCKAGGSGANTNYARIRREAIIGASEEFWLYADLEPPLGQTAYMRLLGTDNTGPAPNSNQLRVSVLLWSDGTLRVRSDHQNHAGTLELAKIAKPSGRHTFALHLVLSKGQDGIADLYIDGELVGDGHRGPTVQASVPDSQVCVTRVYGGIDGAAQQQTTATVTLCRLGVGPANPFILDPPPPPPPPPPDCAEVIAERDVLLEQLEAERALVLVEKDRADRAEQKIASAKAALG